MEHDSSIRTENYMLRWAEEHGYISASERYKISVPQLKRICARARKRQLQRRRELDIAHLNKVRKMAINWWNKKHVGDLRQDAEDFGSYYIQEAWINGYHIQFKTAHASFLKKYYGDTSNESGTARREAVTLGIVERFTTNPGFTQVGKLDETRDSFPFLRAVEEFKVSEPHRSVFLLQNMGYEQTEIASKMNLGPSTVELMLGETRKYLRHKWSLEEKRA